MMPWGSSWLHCERDAGPPNLCLQLTSNGVRRPAGRTCFASLASLANANRAERGCS